MTFANDKHFGIVDVGQCKTGEEYKSRQEMESHEYLLSHNILDSLSLPEYTFYMDVYRTFFFTVTGWDCFLISN